MKTNVHMINVHNAFIDKRDFLNYGKIFLFWLYMRFMTKTYLFLCITRKVTLSFSITVPILLLMLFSWSLEHSFIQHAGNITNVVQHLRQYTHSKRNVSKITSVSIITIYHKKKETYSWFLFRPLETKFCLLLIFADIVLRTW